MIIYPPSPILVVQNSAFLAGSIEQDKADDWQNYVIQRLDNKNITIFNPRRKEWDSSWKEDILNPNFYEQVSWELEAQEKAELIAMYFDPNTKSPISLLELGLFAHSGKLVVCCPHGFWKKGNVDVVCERYHIPQVENLNKLVAYIIRDFKIN
jgi:hypothetical protein